MSHKLGIMYSIVRPFFFTVVTEVMEQRQTCGNNAVFMSGRSCTGLWARYLYSV